jgi:hypothetical protein
VTGSTQSSGCEEDVVKWLTIETTVFVGEWRLSCV